MKINILQRAALIFGAAILIINLFAGSHQTRDWTATLMQSVIICLVCGLLFCGLASLKD